MSTRKTFFEDAYPEVPGQISVTREKYIDTLPRHISGMLCTFRIHRPYGESCNCSEPKTCQRYHPLVLENYVTSADLYHEVFFQKVLSNYQLVTGDLTIDRFERNQYGTITILNQDGSENRKETSLLYSFLDFRQNHDIALRVRSFDQSHDVFEYNRKTNPSACRTWLVEGYCNNLHCPFLHYWIPFVMRCLSRKDPSCPMLVTTYTAFESLPFDILGLIFQDLDIRNLLRISQLSKTLHSAIGRYFEMSTKQDRIKISFPHLHFDARFDIARIDGKSFFDQPLHGSLIVRYKNFPFLTAHLKNGVLDGTFGTLYPDGEHETLTTYKNGKIDGCFLDYHDNGQIRFSFGVVKDDYIHGQMLRGSYHARTEPLVTKRNLSSYRLAFRLKTEISTVRSLYQLAREIHKVKTPN